MGLEDLGHGGSRAVILALCDGHGAMGHEGGGIGSRLAALAVARRGRGSGIRQPRRAGARQPGRGHGRTCARIPTTWSCSSASARRRAAPRATWRSPSATAVARRRPRVVRQLLRGPRRRSTRRTSTPTISWWRSRRRSTSTARRSSLGPKASFGLDFGEVYKRSVIGVRVRGVPAAREGGPRRLLPPHERRLPPPRQGHGVPRRRGPVRLPAPELRQDHRRRASGTAPGTRISSSRARGCPP